jgi:hypothetical protein
MGLRCCRSPATDGCGHRGRLTGLRVETECGGDELGIERIDQVDEARAADRSGRVTAGVEHVAEIGPRSRRPARLGAFGHDDVRVGGVQPGPMIETAQQVPSRWPDPAAPGAAARPDALCRASRSPQRVWSMSARLSSRALGWRRRAAGRACRRGPHAGGRRGHRWSSGGTAGAAGRQSTSGRGRCCSAWAVLPIMSRCRSAWAYEEIRPVSR